MMLVADVGNTETTLGLAEGDRIINSLAASRMYPSECIVVDLGTAAQLVGRLGEVSDWRSRVQEWLGTVFVLTSWQSYNLLEYISLGRFLRVHG
jgi:hypothetical protein